jgi:hypothetical protein
MGGMLFIDGFGRRIAGHADAKLGAGLIARHKIAGAAFRRAISPARPWPAPAGMARFKDHLGGRVKYSITQSAFEHSDDAHRAVPAGSVFSPNTEVGLYGTGVGGALMNVSRPGNDRLVQQDRSYGLLHGSSEDDG